MARFLQLERIRQLLLTVAGANRDVLREAPKERGKQVAMGAVLLSTAAIASVAAAYALYLALDVWEPFAIVGGLAWGLIILNLDRWLVVSAPRLKTKWGTAAMALPRVLLAILIGAVVSTPLTLAVFSSEIDAEINVMAREENERFNDDVNQDSRFQELPKKRDRVAELEQELREGPSQADVNNDRAVADLQRRLDEVSQQYDAAEEAALCERDGTCGTGVPGDGAATDEREAAAERLRRQRDALEQQLADLKIAVQERLRQEDKQEDKDARADLGVLAREIKNLELQQATALASQQEDVKNGDGILARLTALSRIQDSDPILSAAHLLFFLFMTALECLPIIFKTMLGLAPPSLYERLIKLDEEKIVERARLRLQTEYEEAETMARSAIAAAEARAARTLEAESRATGMVLDAQLAVTEEALARWQDEQLNVAMEFDYGSTESDITYPEPPGGMGLNGSPNGHGPFAGSPSTA